jgi:hypothetical protein
MDFGDVRDSLKAYDEISFHRPEWRVLPMTPKHYASHTSHSDPANVSNYEGQILLTVFFDGHTPHKPAASVLFTLQQALFACGAVKAIHTLPTDQENVRDFRVEYNDIRSAEMALQSLNRSLVGVCHTLFIEQSILTSTSGLHRCCRAIYTGP